MQGDTPFRWALAVVLLAAISISGSYRRRARAGETIARSRESGALIAARLIFGLPLVLSLVAFIVQPGWMRWAQVSLPPGVRWAGVATGIVCIPLVYWVVSTLGSNISETVLTKQSHELVRGGPYRWVRHPLYSTGALLLVSAALMTASAFVAVWTALALIAIVVVIVPQEEAHLKARFGEEYRAMMARTGRLLPRLTVRR